MFIYCIPGCMSEYELSGRSFHNMGTVLAPVAAHKATFISGHFDFICRCAGKRTRKIFSATSCWASVW